PISRSMPPPADQNGDLHFRPESIGVSVVCFQQRGDWCLGHLEGCVLRWTRTPDAKSGVFHLAGTPSPPRSHLRSTDDRGLQSQLDTRYSCLSCRPCCSSNTYYGAFSRRTLYEGFVLLGLWVAYIPLRPCWLGQVCTR